VLVLKISWFDSMITRAHTAHLWCLIKIYQSNYTSNAPSLNSCVCVCVCVCRVQVCQFNKVPVMKRSMFSADTQFGVLMCNALLMLGWMNIICYIYNQQYIYIHIITLTDGNVLLVHWHLSHIFSMEICSDDRYCSLCNTLEYPNLITASASVEKWVNSPNFWLYLFQILILMGTFLRIRNDQIFAEKPIKKHSTP